jgi:5-methylcytosine-specific restriction endonuclease McrA
MSRRRRSPKQRVDLFSTVTLPRDRRGVSSITRDMVMERDDYRCQECDNVAVVSSGGSEPVEKLEVCYRVLPTDGGNNSFGNLITLCIQCIRKRGVEPVGGPYDWAQWQ